MATSAQLGEHLIAGGAETDTATLRHLGAAFRYGSIQLANPALLVLDTALIATEGSRT